VPGLLDNKGRRRCHLSLNERWHLLPAFFFTNEPGTVVVELVNVVVEVVSVVVEVVKG
jgi:hypothetical protein